MQIHERKLNLTNQRNAPPCLWNISLQDKRNLSHLINVTYMLHTALHYLSNVLEPGEKYDNHGTALSNHPRASSTEQMGSAQVPPQCPLFPLRSDCARWNFRKGEERVRSQDCSIYKCRKNSVIGTSAAFLSVMVQDLDFFPTRGISFSIWKKVGAATSTKYKQETSP